MKVKCLHNLLGLFALVAASACNKVVESSGALGFAPGQEPSIAETFVPGPVAKVSPTPIPTSEPTPTPTSTPSPTPALHFPGDLGTPTPSPAPVLPLDPGLPTPTPSSSPTPIPTSTPALPGPTANPPPVAAREILAVVFRNGKVEVDLSGGEATTGKVFSIPNPDPVYGSFVQVRPHLFEFTAYAAMPSSPPQYTYFVMDTTAGGVSQSTITVRFMNRPPVALDKSYSLTSSNLFGQILATDPEGDKVTFQLSTPPVYGTVNVNAQTGSFQYQATGEPQPDRFKVRVSDPYQGVVEMTAVLTATASSAGTTMNLVSLTAEDRNPNSAGVPNFGPGQRSVMRDSQGRAWFVQEGSVDFNQQVINYANNDGIRYSLWSEGQQKWVPQIVLNMFGYTLLRTMVGASVTELAAHIMVDDVIYSYGKSSLSGAYIDECAFMILGQFGSCSLISPKPVLGSPSASLSEYHYVGAAVSPSKTRVVWTSRLYGFSVLYRPAGVTGTWNVVSATMPCDGFRNGQPKFFNNRLVVIGECVGVAGAADRLMAMEWTMGGPAPRFYDLSALSRSATNYDQVFPVKLEADPKITKAFDIWIDSLGGYHMIGGTSSGHAVYLFRTGTSGWTGVGGTDYLFAESTNHARFFVEGRKLSIVRGTNFMAPEGRIVIARNTFATLPDAWGGFALDISQSSRFYVLDSSVPAFPDPQDSAGAIYVESSALQTAPTKSQFFLFQSQLSPYGRTVWHFPTP